MSQSNDDRCRSVLTNEELSRLLDSPDGEVCSVLMLGFEDSTQDNFLKETGFDPVQEFTTCLDIHLSIEIGKLINAGKKHFFTLLKCGTTARMARCCARIRDDESDPRKPVLWVVVSADQLSSCSVVEEKAIHDADHVLAIREFDEERITDELVCNCGTILSMFSHPEDNSTLQGAASAGVEIVNVNPADILSAYNHQKQHGSKPAPQ